MAFDWTKVSGYREDLTAEEKIELLKGFEIEPAGKTVSKQLFDNTASELAKLKKDLNDRMSEDERKEKERADQEKALKDELEQLRKERAEDKFKARLLEAKFTGDEAAKMAKAYVDGDMETFLNALSDARTNHEKVLRSEIMKETPRPGAGDPTKNADTATDVAVRIAKDTAASNKNAGDVLSHYI
jgi:hypothetical protein